MESVARQQSIQTDIRKIFIDQQAFFNTNQTKEVDYRIAQLKKLKKLLKANEPMLYRAIYEDFGKSEFETYATELSLLYHELNLFLRNIRWWSRRKAVSTGLANFPANSYIMPEPLGTTLVIGAWNYPYQISLLPAISSLAAGNTVILKPSELPANTARAMAKLINENFPSHYFTVVEGGVPETSELLANPFDKIFFYRQYQGRKDRLRSCCQKSDARHPGVGREKPDLCTGRYQYQNDGQAYCLGQVFKCRTDLCGP